MKYRIKIKTMANGSKTYQAFHRGLFRWFPLTYAKPMRDQALMDIDDDYYWRIKRLGEKTVTIEFEYINKQAPTP